MLKSHLRTIGFAVALLAVGAAPLQSASATTASGSAHLDWSGLSIDAGGGSLTNPFSISTITFIQSPAIFVFDTQNAPDDTTPLESGAHVSFPGLFDFDLVASATAAAMDASFNLVSPLPGSAFNGTSSDAYTNRSLSIVALSAGTLTVTLPYSLDVATDEAGVYSQAYAYMSMRRIRGAGSTFNVSTSPEVIADLAGDPIVSDSGFLVLTLPFLSGDRFNLYAEAHVIGYAFGAPAPVPLPPTALLLGGGMLGLLWRRRAA